MKEGYVRRWFKALVYLNNQIDTDEAAARIKRDIWFRGHNVWILAFSVIIASVGLNINSTAVIIGAMLISPLLGPIMGVGLSLGINDKALLLDALRNFLIMVLVGLTASFLYFLISPLNLVNPTELLARTRPTIYDVLIAFFGGLAGILESSRKEKGMVLSGVAIATALMPPLCTAGYGLAKGNPNFFLGALMLFLINVIFIILATYFMVKYLRFKEVEYSNPETARHTHSLMTLVILAVTVPSIWSAVRMVGENNFERNVQSFVTDNKNFGQGYIYDYKIPSGRVHKVEIYYAGAQLSDKDREDLETSAVNHGLKPGQVEIKESDFGSSSQTMDTILKGIYENAESEIERKEARIEELQREILELKGRDIEYRRIAREVRYNFPEVKELSIGKGANVDDSLRVEDRTLVLAHSVKPIPEARLLKIEEWVRLRLDDTTATVHNIIDE